MAHSRPPRGPRLISPARAPATIPPPLIGRWAALDTSLEHAERYPLPTGRAPEDVLIDADGALVAGGVDGRLWRWAPGAAPGDEPRLLADTGGRPLGIELDPRDGTLLVCDAHRGLLRVDPAGRITELVTTAAGRPLVFCNNAAVAADGTVFFTDSSSRYPIEDWRRDMLEYRPNGRLLVYQPDTGAVEVLVDRLYFPNGVALTPDGAALILAETSRHRLLRVALADGVVTELLDLPAYPDNVSAAGDGGFWVALPSPRLPVLEKLLPHPGIRRLAALLPVWAQPRERPYGLVALVDAAGAVRRTIHAPAGGYRMVTGVRQHGDLLYLGSLHEPAVARIRLTDGHS